MAGLFRRGDLPEPPPPGWERLPPHPDYAVREVDPVDVDRLCKVAGVTMGDYGRGRFGACVDRAGRQVILPAGMDPQKAAATRAHEFPHTWGATHGARHKGWVGPDGKPLEPLTDARAALMVSMAQALARQQAAPPPATEPARGLLALGNPR